MRQGEVFGFLGPNGAGKSTTIRLLLGELRPTAGTATVLGATPREVDHRHTIGYVPADLSLWPAMTGRQTLAFFSKLRGGVDRRQIDALSERLSADLDKRVGNSPAATGRRSASSPPSCTGRTC
ncbi:ATP-binding cassette domain-containing protein [Tessaracoccus coleopterorum]|uniref:ATP-binding cassette domain-containing protein n=1 Tax=Tessaracoccus coleopterorum TaxID=2714950 RepID=UPI0018D30C18